MRDTLVKPEPVTSASPSAAVAPSEFPGGMRVTDKVLAAFNHACAMNDLEAADDLLALLEKLTERRIRRFGGDRRKESFQVFHAREHLEFHRNRRLG
jgi:hypothetical protein